MHPNIYISPVSYSTVTEMATRKNRAGETPAQQIDENPYDAVSEATMNDDREALNELWPFEGEDWPEGCRPPRHMEEDWECLRCGAIIRTTDGRPAVCDVCQSGCGRYSSFRRLSEEPSPRNDVGGGILSDIADMELSIQREIVEKDYLSDQHILLLHRVKNYLSRALFLLAEKMNRLEAEYRCLPFRGRVLHLRAFLEDGRTSDWDVPADEEYIFRELVKE